MTTPSKFYKAFKGGFSGTNLVGTEYSRLSPEEALSALDARKEGLSGREVRSRVAKYGTNTIAVKKRASFWHLLLQQFKSYIIWLLIIIAAFAFITGSLMNRHEQIIDGIIVTFIIVFNALIGAYQDYKSEKAAELLTSLMKTKARVRRDGKETVVDAEELTVGDIVLLEEGERVPADGRIIECADLAVDEALLTGESKASSKQVKAMKSEVSLADRTDMVYMNTFVTRGTATIVVTGIGSGTEVGRIAKSLGGEKPSPFVAEVDEAARKITYVALVLIAFVSVFLFIRGFHWVDIFMIASALVIGSIPEGLPAIVTFALASTTTRLAKLNVLVKRKSLLETLGSIDVICTDKTGTLTQNRMTVKKLWFDGEVHDANAKDLKKLSGKKTFEAVRHTALLANEAKDTDKGFMGNAEDLALIDVFNDVGTDIFALQKQYPRTKISPFSSETKCVVSIHKHKGRAITYRKGAPEVVLAACKSILAGGKARKLTARDKHRIEDELTAFSSEALRIIAFSYKEGERGKEVFVGFAGIYDPPQEGIQKVVKTIYGANIELKMITGDNIRTAEAIAKECGFRDIRAISWDDLKDMSTSQLKKVVDEYNVFARMSPEFKLRIVSTLQESGKRVGITGDGVNDVPALKTGEVGIAMGKRGSDIAKEAGDIILLDDKLSTVTLAVQQGRTVFANVRKVLNYLLTSNVAEVMVVFIAALIGKLPFTAIQLLWVNFVTDVAPAMALGVDPSHKHIMQKKPTGADEKIINGHIVWLTVLIGLTKVVLLLTIFFFTLWYSGNMKLAQTMTFTWLVFSHFIRVATIRFDEGVSLFINPFLNYAVLVPIILQLLIIYTPLASFFGVVRLSVLEWVVIACMTALSVLIARGVTRFVNRIDPHTAEDY